MTFLKIFLFCSLLLPFLAQSQVPTHDISLLDGKLQMTIPDSLYQMSVLDSVAGSKSHHPGQQISFGTKTRTARLTIDDLQQNSIAEDKIAKTMDNMIVALQAKITDSRIINRGDTMVSGKKAYYFKAELPFFGTPEPAFYYSTMTVREGHMLIFTFTCGISLMPAWEKEFDKIMASVQAN